MDWSSQNVLSVGLGHCVYLWSAYTSQVTRLCDLSPDGDTVTSVSWSERVRNLYPFTLVVYLLMFSAGQQIMFKTESIFCFAIIILSLLVSLIFSPHSYLHVSCCVGQPGGSRHTQGAGAGVGRGQQQASVHSEWPHSSCWGIGLERGCPFLRFPRQTHPSA